MRRFLGLPAAPLRRLLLGWQAIHGDDVTTMALGFDLDVGLVHKLIGRRPASRLTAAEARTCCVALRAHPTEIWPTRTATRLGPVSWETEAFWSDAGIDPIVVEHR